MPRKLCTLLLMLTSGAGHADVLDHNHGLITQMMHQAFGLHHLPYTLLLILVGALAFRGWRAARK
ncbi:MAG: hypothetical protein WBN23_04870 [Woeseia sp.]